MKRHTWLLVALVAGAALGLLLRTTEPRPWLDQLNRLVFQPIGQIFLRLVFMVVVPLVFSALVLGVYELGKGRGLGRVAGRTLMFTVVMSSISVVIGVGIVNLLRPGAGLKVDAAALEGQASAIAKVQEHARGAKGLRDILMELVPRNPLDSAVRALDGDMIPFMFFALAFGLALVAVSRGAAADGPLVGVLEQVLAVSMRIIEFAMKLAPAAVFAIMFGTVYSHGVGLLRVLAWYVVAVIAGLAVQQTVVYGALLKYLGRRSPVDFFRRSWDVCVYAFSTSSSNATLPLALETAEHKLRLPQQTSRFVLTVGATANQNGTALFEGVTILFLAQVFGVAMSIGQQVQVVLLAIVAGIGTAGVPGGSLPLIAILLQHFHIPPEGIGLILGVDRLLDPCRTVVNVCGDLVITALVGRGVDEPGGPAKSVAPVS